MRAGSKKFEHFEKFFHLFFERRNGLGNRALLFAVLIEKSSDSGGLIRRRDLT